MAGEVPSGEGSVFHYIDMFALGFVLAAVDSFVAGRPWWIVVGCCAVSIALHLVGTKWNWIRTKLGFRLSLIFARTLRVALVLFAVYAVTYALMYVHQLRSDLDVYVMPRIVTAEQSEQISKSITGHNPGTTLHVFVSAADREALEYAAQLTNSVKGGDWDAFLQPLNPWDNTPAKFNYGSFINAYLQLEVGIVIRSGWVVPPKSYDERHPTPEDILAEAFRKAGFASVGNGSGPSRDGQYHLDIEVGRRPAIKPPTIRSQIVQWLMMHPN